MAHRIGIIDVQEWARENDITLLPCTPKSKKPLGIITTRAIYGNDAEMAVDDSFHMATEERIRVINKFWGKRDFISQLNEKDIGASIEMNPGFNGGYRMCCIDVDAMGYVNEFLQNDFFKGCPAITGKKGLKLFCKLIERDEIPTPLIQYYEDDNPNPQIEVFTRDRHALIYGEHPDSTTEEPIYYTFVRGFGEMIPELEWKKVKGEIQQIAEKRGLRTRGEKDPIVFEDGDNDGETRAYDETTISDELRLDIRTIAMPVGKIHREGDEIRGENPWHGSTSGNNFVINPKKNVWHCHRCGSGGGALEAFAISNGIIKCHEACQGCLDGKWNDIFVALEKEGYQLPKKKKQSSNPKKETKATGKEKEEKPIEKKIVPKVDSKYTKTALEILKREGQPLKYMLNTFAKSHIGDQVVAECLVLSLASQTVWNTKGVHIFISGKSGKGKSHCTEVMLEQVPEEYRITGSISDKVLFYMENLQEGSVIVYDDKEFSDDMSETFKNATSRFKTGYTHYTLDTNRNPIELTIPPRCVWWMARVEDPGDEQVQNRMLTPWIDDSPEQDIRVNEYELNEETKDLTERVRDMESTIVCQEIWRIIKRQLIFVKIPYANYIRFNDVQNRRDTGMFMDRIKAYAVLNFLNRNPKIIKMPDGTEIVGIEASKEDFDAAESLDNRLPTAGGGMRNRLIKTEAMAIETIRRMGWREFTLEDMQRAMALSLTSIRRIFHGRRDRGDSAGLLGKCSAFSMDKVTVSEEDPETGRKSTHVNRYKFDPEAYAIWVGKSGIWVDWNAWGRDQQKNDGNEDDDAPETRTNLVEALERLVLGSEIESAEPIEEELNEIEDLEELEDKPEPSNPDPRGTPPTEPRQETGIVTTSLNGSRKGTTPPVMRKRSDTNKTKSFTLRTQDYIEIYPPEVGKCDLCEGNGILYKEKFNTDIRRTKRRGRKICKTCYTEALRKEISKEQERIEGLIDIDECEKVSENVGSCDQCKVRRGEYRENGTNRYLCSTCYETEVARYNKLNI